ncbi:MAG TPA: 1,4-alpha-glucan branching protein GlgB [Candidatus Limiplasma sp.]|nr:1,4-alpha-glucan branching protein GlgB [Candidatus Limiplasma sp.]HRX08719.1 1,4-alpha-glucan branching protein GlgB [Candidatus Limiplasma sp.]
MQYSPPTQAVRDTFHQGTNRHAYEMLGAHPCLEGKAKKWHFCVWAPNARHVSLTGSFCGWNDQAYPMQKQHDGTWELRLSEAELFKDVPLDGYPVYKYAVTGADGKLRLKADPYGFFSELRPNMGSRLYDLDGYTWNDSAWMKQRSTFNPYVSPVNIYEVHIASWRRHEDGSLYTYPEFADEIIPYVQEMGYTHIELLPVMEHPLDMSWGYQVLGFYAATSRYGTPKQLMEFIDRCHQAGIGVLLDWVPAHFPRDEAGLFMLDGTPLYNHPDKRRGEIAQWGTMLFDFGRGEVCSYLLSNACFWLEQFHADGLRVDAVSGLLYYDFCKEQGEWLPNEYGGRENIDAIRFLRRMNETVYHDFAGVMMIAEEASAYPMVTAPTYLGGLGFGLKWNMGWMNDILSYLTKDPVHRKYHHDKLTFSLVYAFSENYVLPFSHDEVVHGKHSMLDKNPGDLWQKFAGLRTVYAYTMAHPGKKLLFMGGEFAQFIEWKYDDQLDWFLLVYDRHPQVQACVKALNHLYRSTKAFYEVEDSWDGFQWITASDTDNSVVAFLRTDAAGKAVLCVANFMPVFHPIYRIGLPLDGTLNEIFNTDRREFGGSDQYNAYEISVHEGDYNSFPYHADICVPPLSCCYFSYEKILPAQGVLSLEAEDEKELLDDQQQEGARAS